MQQGPLSFAECVYFIQKTLAQSGVEAILSLVNKHGQQAYILRGIEVNFATAALHASIESGNTFLVNHLLGLSFIKLNTKGTDLVHLAVFCKQYDIAKLLVEDQRIDPNPQQNFISLMISVAKIEDSSAFLYALCKHPDHLAFLKLNYPASYSRMKEIYTNAVFKSYCLAIGENIGFEVSSLVACRKETLLWQHPVLIASVTKSAKELYESRSNDNIMDIEQAHEIVSDDDMSENLSMPERCLIN